MSMVVLLQLGARHHRLPYIKYCWAQLLHWQQRINRMGWYILTVYTC